MRGVARIGSGLAVALASVAVLGAGATPARADTGVLTKLLGEGGSFAEAITDKLQADSANDIAPLVPQYFDPNVSVAMDDFASGAADYGVTEVPLTSTQAGIAQGIGRKFAYVPFAASAVTIGAVVECSNDTVLKSTTMCPNLQVTMPQLAEIFGGEVSAWNDPSLAKIGGGSPISPTNSSVDVTPRVLIDPTVANLVLEQAFVADPTAKTLWDSYLTNLKITDDTPSLSWPSDTGISGGDPVLVQKLVPIDPNTNAVVPNPQLWGQGLVAPIPIDWQGAPRNVPTIAIQNGAKAFVSPTPAAETAALNDATFDATTNLVTFQNSTTDAAAYPLMAMSYLVVPTTGLSADKATALATYIKFVLGSQGQQDIESFGAIPPTQPMITAGLAVANEVAAEATSVSSSSGTTGTSTTGTSASTGETAGTGGSGTAGVTTASDTGPTLAATGADTAPVVAAGVLLAAAGLLGRRRLLRRVAAGARVDGSGPGPGDRRRPR